MLHHIRFSLLAATVAMAACDSQLDSKPSAEVKSDAEKPAEKPDAHAAADAEAEKKDAEKTEVGSLSIDKSKSLIGFVGAKVTADHEGKFEDFEGHASLEGDTPKSVEFTVKTASLAIEPEKLKQHLSSEDFFAIETFPEAKFTSKAIHEKAAEGATHEIEGDLTLHGETKTIVFPATITVNETRAEGKAEFKINRQDFGISYPGMKDDLIKDDVLLKLHLVFPRA